MYSLCSITLRIRILLLISFRSMLWVQFLAWWDRFGFPTGPCMVLVFLVVVIVAAVVSPS